MSKKKKVRVELRKNRAKPPRQKGFTRDYQDHGFADEATLGGERVRAKGDLSRRRTIIQDVTPSAGQAGEAVGTAMPAVDPTVCRPGRVLRVHGLWSIVEAEGGQHFRCAVRRLLKTFVTDERSIVTTGDRVWFRPAGLVSGGVVSGESSQPASDDLPLTTHHSPLTPTMPEGLIERVEPRHGVLTRASRRREHVLVANVDQLVIVMSLVEPELKPHLIDRYIVVAEQGELTPVVCLNKADLVPGEMLQPLIGAYSQLGIPTFLTSAVTGKGLDQLRRRLADRATVFSGQSGVGKSSLLNALQPGLGLHVREVSETNQKGRHTTTTSQLIRLDLGGWVVDTPGLRQLQLWDVRPEEVEGYFREFRPFVPLCAFPDCTHTHEAGCAIKRAVRRKQIREHRYLSYLGLFGGTLQ